MTASRLSLHRIHRPRAEAAATVAFGYLLARSTQLRTHAIQNIDRHQRHHQRVTIRDASDTFCVVVPPRRHRSPRSTERRAPLFDQINANSTESRTLATLRDTLLPKLLSGELSVNPQTDLTYASTKSKRSV